MKTVLALAAAALLAGPAAAAEAADGKCHVGLYRMADGSLLDVGVTTGGLRWRRMDGSTAQFTPADGGLKATVGWTKRPAAAPSFGACAEGRISFQGQIGQMLRFEVQETTFTGANGVKLAGRLVLPPGDGAVPVSVMLHGSESTSARDFNFEQRAWPAHGVGVFVYDKRGTGGSDGKYTQDFHVLAQDAVAAVAEARRLAGRRAARVGVDGGSQGGWIGPLTATLTPVDYVIARYGLAESPLAEDREQVMLDLRSKGYGPDVLAKAREVTDATGRVVASGFKSGWDELAAVTAKYRDELWFKDFRGEFSGDVARNPPELVRVVGPQRDVGTTWEYEPMDVLPKVKAPILWVLAAEDLEAPVAETRRRLLSLQKAGQPITVIEFPKTDHGIREFEVVEGKREYTRYADGYYQAVLEFTRTGRLGSGPYGAALRLTP